MPITLAVAAERLGVSAATLRSQIRYGRLRATKYGNTYVVTEGETERYRRESLGKPGHSGSNSRQ